MKWLRIPLLYVLALLALVAQLAENDGLVDALDKEWWIARAKEARGDEPGVRNSCWRKAKRAVNNACPEGYKKKSWLNWCTANCPRSMPIRCGPTCLAPGHSCVHETTSKVTMIGLFVAKAFGVGFMGMEEACTLAVSASRNGRLRRLDEVTECKGKIAELSAIEPEEFAELVKAVFPDDVIVKPTQSRLLRLQGSGDGEGKTVGTNPFTCAARMIEAIKAIAAAIKEAKADPASKEMIFGGTDLLTAVNAVIAACGDSGVGEGIVSLLEMFVKAAAERMKDSKPYLDIGIELGLKMLMKMEPTGLIAFCSEFVHRTCVLDYEDRLEPTITGEVTMGPDGDHLNLTRKGEEVAALAGRYSPTTGNGDLVITITNRIAAELKIKTYSGGRRLRTPAAAGQKREKRVDYIREETSVAIISVKLDDVRGTDIRVEAVVDENALMIVRNGMVNKVKDFLELIGKPKTVIRALPHKFAEFSFYVPKGTAGKGEMVVAANLGRGPLNDGQ